MMQRRRALEAWAEQTNGFLGCSPDHVASSLCGMMMRLDLFQTHGEKRAQALGDYFEYVRDSGQFVTYVVVSPQGLRPPTPLLLRPKDGIARLGPHLSKSPL